MALSCAILLACSTVPSFQERRASADALATNRNWRQIVLPEPGFDLVAYSATGQAAGDLLTVYIEGDGLAWIDRDEPSANPTPLNPVALRMALAQPDGNAVYLARPCQFVDANLADCSRHYWTDRRFAPEVIAAMNAAVESLKLRYGATSVVLVGYSGGGAVAALIAARREDVSLLVTVAGNLDIDAWSALHRASPLDGSLNPSNEIQRLSRVRQLHFVGGDDHNVPPDLVQGYASRFPADVRPIVQVEANFDHQCCWAENWPRLWRLAVSLTR
jgi:hypothetical protein